ncbi:SURF1 family protein [Nocardioides sp. URHA0020]|uniref:SURF1 family protein n=1 Tax=Nocardioides sp. URHA0020 TaxID=1380392 RepID=UPI00048F981B|nr:SURF1 family protein [Nocardioides sp. URHA0020]
MPSPLAPRYWGAHLLAVVLVAAAVGLGVWQYDAWQAHRDAEADDLTHARPVPLTDVIGPDDPFPGTKVGQPVTVSGTWVPGGTVYVSGRVQDGAKGYWVVTPLTVDDADGSALPIVRGWVADPAQAPAAPSGPTSLDAWLQPPEGTGEVDRDPTDDVLPQLRIADLIQHVDQDLYGAYGVATEPEPGLERASVDQLPDVGTFTGIRNLLYAIEWWFFGLFAAFIWWRWVTDTAAERPVVEDAAGSPPRDP